MLLKNPEVIRGLNECIVRLEADKGKRISASMQVICLSDDLCQVIWLPPVFSRSNYPWSCIDGYESSQLALLSDYGCFFFFFPADALMSFYQIPDFGTDLAISTRSELDPGDSTRILCTSLFTQELVFDKFNFFFSIF